MWRGRGFSPRAAPLTRPIRSLLSRCAAPSSWPQIGLRSSIEIEARNSTRTRQRVSPAPDPIAGVGIHHSSPREVCTYSGQRKSTGGLKSLGSSGATHCVPPIPPPGAVSELVLRLFQKRRFGQQVEEDRSNRFGAEED